EMARPPLPWGEDTEPCRPKAGIGEVGEGRDPTGEYAGATFPVFRPSPTSASAAGRPCSGILSPWERGRATSHDGTGRPVPRHAEAASSASFATVFMFRPVPTDAAGILSFERPMPAG